MAKKPNKKHQAEIDKLLQDASILLKLGELEDTVQKYERIKKLDPSNFFALSALVSVKKGKMHCVSNLLTT